MYTGSKCKFSSICSSALPELLHVLHCFLLPSFFLSFLFCLPESSWPGRTQSPSYNFLSDPTSRQVRCGPEKVFEPCQLLIIERKRDTDFIERQLAKFRRNSSATPKSWALAFLFCVVTSCAYDLAFQEKIEEKIEGRAGLNLV